MSGFRKAPATADAQCVSDLVDLVEAFKREVAVPGTFASTFPDTSDPDLASALADAFGNARLDGFFGTMTLDVDAGTVEPDLSVAGAALVVIYAGLRMTRTQLRTLPTGTRYKAGPVEYETQQSSAALTEDLKQLERRRQELIAMAVRAGRGAGSTFVIDNYVARSSSFNFYGGFFPWEMAAGTFGFDGSR
jgi:hypothetical protein